jgi:hypothetical protein
MSGAPADPFEAGVRIAAALAAAGVPYALGGALAYGLWGVPRATVDVDVNTFVHPDDVHRVCEALRSLGISVDEPKARDASQREGMFIVDYAGFRVDVFTASIDFSWEAARTRVTRDVDGQPVDFLSAEALAVFKLLFFRGKDIVDLERLVALRKELDHAWVRAQIVSMMGADDPRVVRWDELVATFARQA